MTHSEALVRRLEAYNADTEDAGEDTDGAADGDEEADVSEPAGPVEAHDVEVVRGVRRLQELHPRGEQRHAGDLQRATIAQVTCVGGGSGEGWGQTAINNKATYERWGCTT